MKRWIPVCLLFLLVLGGIWFWSLGSLPEDTKASVVVLSEIAGDVQTRPSEDGAWSSAMAGQNLAAGAAVRTGKDGRASVRFFDRGVSRLAPETTLVIDALAKGGEPFTDTDIRIRLESGRVWSRLLRLLDLDAGFRAETSDVVATVRGTAFSLEKTAATTTLFVVQSAVEWKEPSDSADGRMTVEGFGQAFASGEFGERMPIPEEVMASAWVKENMSEDEKFFQDDVSGERVPPAPVDSLARLSERLHARVSSEDKRFARDSRYLLRRLRQARALVHAGRDGEAFKRFASLENEVRARLAQDAGSRLAIRAALANAWMRLFDLPPEHSAYRLKQRVEDLLLETARTPEERIFLRLSGLDARLDEARDAFAIASDRAAIRQTADVVVRGLENARRDMDEHVSRIADARMRKLRSKILAVQARLEALQGRFSPFENAGAASTKIPEGATPAAPVPIVKPRTAPFATTSAPLPSSMGLPFACKSLEVFMQPNPVEVGKTAALFVRATKLDGSTADVTASASFRTVGNLGTMTKGVFSALAAGSMQIQADVTCQGQTASGSLSVQIHAGPVALKSLSVSASPATLSFFGRSSLTAILVYANDAMKDVSALTECSTSNPNVGVVSGGTFVAGQTAGSVVVTCSYTEDGITLTGAATLTVAEPIQPPSAKP